MRYYIIAGEASGDLHASNLIKALNEIDAAAEIRGWGGDKMAAEGAVIVKHYRDLAFMGFAEVIANIRTIFNNLSFCKKEIMEFKPDIVILIDYPGFNLRIASFLHENNIRTAYYISPQVWAWKKSRVKTIRKVVDKLIVILPFEKDFFKDHDVEAEFVGHPLLDALSADDMLEQSFASHKTRVALLPGSRKQEIKKVLPEMISIINDFPEVEFVVAGVSSIGKEFYEKLIGNSDVKIEINNTYNLLKDSKAALVTSGTATLETALIGIPEVVCYKGGWISYTIAKQLIKVKYISLVNLIMNRLVVKELIQQELNRKSLSAELDNLLNNPKYRNRMLDSYKELKKVLGGGGASKRTAEIIVNYLKTDKQSA